MESAGCGYQIAGLTSNEEPSGRWYDLDECELEEGGTYRVKVSVTEAATKAGMAGARADGVKADFIRRIPGLEDEKTDPPAQGEGGEEKEKPSSPKGTDGAGSTAAQESVTGSDAAAAAGEPENKTEASAPSNGANTPPPEDNDGGGGAQKKKPLGAGTGITPDTAGASEEYDLLEEQNATSPSPAPAQPQAQAQGQSKRPGTTATTRVRIPSRKGSSANGSVETPMETPMDVKKVGWEIEKEKEVDYEAMSKEDLIKRVKSMRKEIDGAKSTIAGWEKGVRQILNCIILSPMMNHFYRQKLTTILENVFLGVSSISNVVYINCSFPSIEAEFPNVKLQSWSGLERSTWKVKWKPSWHITARVEGSHYLSFTLNILIRKLSVKGEFNLECAKDLTTVTIWFNELPTIDLQIQTTIVLGILPIPLSIMQETLASKIRTAFIGWLKDNLVYPNSLQFPCLRGYGGLNEEAILEEAKAAAKVAQRSLQA